MSDKVAAANGMDEHEIYDKLVSYGVRHPLVARGWNVRLLKEGWFYIEFNGNAEWLGGDKKEVFERIELMFEQP